MRDAAGERAEGFELLCLHEFVPGLIEQRLRLVAFGGEREARQRS